MAMRRTTCSSLNHRRDNAPVRCCPDCGEIVNEGIPKRHCDDGEHAIKRRERNKYCTLCGDQLIQNMI